jgi:trimeric autotransporter adhesin
MPPFKTPAACSHHSAILPLAAAVAIVFARPPQAHAANLTWDANPGATGAQDGSGTWINLNLANWWNGTTNAQWNSSTPDSAIFGSASGAAGVVALASNISVDDITFNPAGSGSYTIEGAGNTLTLVNTLIKGTANATLNVNLAGTSGLFVINTGIIRLGGANTYSGITSAQGGILQIDSAEGLGNSTEIVVLGNVSSPLSTLLINVPDSTSTTFGAGKSVTLSGASINFFGSLLGADGANNTWAGNIGLDSFGAHISGGNNGTLNITGVISGGLPQVVFSTNTNATTVLSGVNLYRGDTQLFNNVAGSTATLKIGIDDAINANSRLTVLPTSTAGLQVVDLNGHLLTFRSLDTSSATTIAAAANLRVTNNDSAPATLTVGDPAGNQTTFGGSIRDGLGTLSLVKEGVNTQILAAENIYTGPTTVNSGILQLGRGAPISGNVHFNGADAVLASTSFFLNGGTFQVDNSGSSNTNDNRLADGADFFFGGGSFFYLGTDSVGGTSSETVGDLVLRGGVSEIRVAFGRVNAVTFNANQIVRAGPTAFVSGDSLGKDSTSTAAVARLFLANAPTLVGTTAPLSTGINANAKDTRIVPFLIGEATAVTGGLGSATGTPNTFLTYQASTGFRPLNPIDEFTNNAIVQGSNTRISAATTATASAAINSLVMHGNNLTLATTATLTNTSGAVLFVAGNEINNGTLDFGSAEGLITVNAAQTGIIGSSIIGTIGFTLNGPGTLELGSPSSTYSGNTTVRSGTLVPQRSSVGAPGAVTSGPFGKSTLVLAGGSVRAPANTPVTIANNILFQGDTTIAAGGNSFTLSGPVTLAGGTRVLTNSVAGNTNFTTFSGQIGDNGLNRGLTISGSGTSPVVLSGANTYTGPTTVLSSTLIVSGSLTGASTTTVGNSAALATPGTLGGSGTLGNVIAIGSGDPSTSGATVSPGNSANVAGIMKTGAFSLTNGAHLSLQIGGIVAGGETTTGYDQIKTSGPVTLTGGDLKLTLLGAPTFTFGNQLYLVVNNSGSGVTGVFTTLNGAAFNPSNILLGGNQFQLAYNGNFNGAGSDGIANDVMLVAVPEPNGCIMLPGALGLLASARRRRG